LGHPVFGFFNVSISPIEWVEVKLFRGRKGHVHNNAISFIVIKKFKGPRSDQEIGCRPVVESLHHEEIHLNPVSSRKRAKHFCVSTVYLLLAMFFVINVFTNLCGVQHGCFWRKSE